MKVNNLVERKQRRLFRMRANQENLKKASNIKQVLDSHQEG